MWNLYFDLENYFTILYDCTKWFNIIIFFKKIASSVIIYYVYENFIF
jgi:hypothetical protein